MKPATEEQIAKLGQWMSKVSDLLYVDEIEIGLGEVGLEDYYPHMKAHMYRWYHCEVLAFIRIVSKSLDPSIPTVDASKKEIPSFLLKENKDDNQI